MRGEVSSATVSGAASRAGDGLQRERAQDQTGVRACSSLVPRSNKYQRKGPDSDVQVLSGAERGHLVPDPRPRKDHPSGNRVSTTRGHNDARHNASIRGGMQTGETSRMGNLRPQTADDGGRRRGRPLSREGRDDGQEILSHGEDENRLESDGNDAGGSSVYQGKDLSLSGAKESNRPRSSNDSSMPEESTENFPRDKHRRGQQQSSPSAAPVASRDDPGPAETAGTRGKVGGTKRSWGVPQFANTADDAGRNTCGRRPGGRQNDGNAEKEQAAHGGRSASSAQNNDHDRFARGRPGDRYYLPPPQRNSRPRTAPDDSGSTTSSGTPRLNERRRKDRQPWAREPRERERQQGRQRKTSRDMSRRSGGDHDNVESSPCLQSRRREVRTSSSSDRLYRQQPADHRPMLGAAEASGVSSMPDWRYGWRGPSTTTSSTQSPEEESMPYYVDRKQVGCVFGLQKGKVPEICWRNAAEVRFTFLMPPSMRPNKLHGLNFPVPYTPPR